MKRTLLPLIALFISLAANAQIPELTVDGKANNGVVLQELKIDISICGPVAKTTWQMTFKNNTNRILEGYLSFPLKEGISVSRYALDINGKMREAVPVERSKGTAVFEATERRRIDPGLLEKTAGNVFRTRIYPINANSTRTIIIGYEEDLPITAASALQYYLPLNLKDTVKKFSLNVTVQNDAAPLIDSLPSDNFHFEQQHYNFTASSVRTNFIPDRPLAFSIPKPKDIPEAVMQERDGKNYFLVNTLIDKKEKPKALPSHITLLWDASLSGLQQDTAKEFSLLQDYFSYVKNASITLVVFSNNLQSKKEYTLSNGNWDALRKDLSAVIYDGATNFGCLDLNKISTDEFLLFSDGQQTFGNSKFKFSKTPVYCINTAVSGDFSNLEYISKKTGAAFINLQSMNEYDAVQLLINVPLRFIGIKNNPAIEEVYPSDGIVTGNNFCFAGILKEDHQSITLQFGFGNTVSFEKTVDLDKSKTTCEDFDISNVWAQKKINSLEMQYDDNRQAIEATGKRFGIATKNTSLIVLESVNDYLQYQIEPPAELREEYDELIKSGNYDFSNKDDKNVEPAIKMSNELKKWWGIKPIVLPKPKPVKPINPRPLPVARVRKSLRPDNKQKNLEEVVVVGYGTRKKEDVTYSYSTLSNATVQTVPVQDEATALSGRLSGVTATSADGENSQVTISGAATFANPIANGFMEADSTAISGSFNNNNSTSYYSTTTTAKNDKLTEKDSEEFDYINQLKSAAKQHRYTVYLQLRNNFKAIPVFFFKAADLFFKDGDTATGLKVLSNLAEMNLANYELDRLMGYKLKQQNLYQEEVDAFKKVLDERPGDPQSYRDYALALEDAGLHQQALDELYKGMTKQYDGDVSSIYNGIEETFLMEMNRIISMHKNLDTKNIEKEFIQSAPVDLRVVINWNKSNTDIDLWVTDPNEEKCYFSHKATAIRGRLSTDFTQGFGPEQFLLKNAPKGKYRIQINYFGDRQVTIAGPTTVMAEIYKYYGTPKEEKKIVVLQMEKGATSPIFIGNVEF